MHAIHQLKVDPEHWDKYMERFFYSIRKDDRGFNEGDYCLFQCTGEVVCGDTAVLAKILKITKHTDFPKGLKKDYCILDFEITSQTRL